MAINFDLKWKELHIFGDFVDLSSLYIVMFHFSPVSDFIYMCSRIYIGCIPLAYIEYIELKEL